MKEPYSVKEIAEILTGSKDSEEFSRVYRQIRYWTEKDALPPAGDTTPGTGVSLEYDEDRVYHAAILQELSRIGVDQSALTLLAVQLADGYETRLWSYAKIGKAQVYLTGLFGPSGNISWELSQGAPLTERIAENPDNPELKKPGNPYFYTSAVVINLTSVFRRMNFV